MFSKFPFMLTMIGAIGTSPIPGAKVNINRVIEAIVIAVVCALGTAYTTVKVLETKMDQMERFRVEDRLLSERDRAEMKSDIKEIKDIVYDHILTTTPKR